MSESTRSVTALEISGIEFAIELALSRKEKWQGLSDRESLAPRTGMLFVWDKEEPRRFSMRRMHFRLDILFIDQRGVLINRYCNLSPWDGSVETWYYSEKPAKFVLQLNGGTCEYMEIKAGDILFDPQDVMIKQAETALADVMPLDE